MNLAKSYICVLTAAILCIGGYFGIDYLNTRACGDFMTYYYRHPSPERVPRILRTFLKLNNFRKHSQEFSGAIASYWFGRTAALAPRLLPEYVLIYDKADKWGKIFLLNTFLVCNDAYVRQHLTSRRK